MPKDSIVDEIQQPYKLIRRLDARKIRPGYKGTVTLKHLDLREDDGCYFCSVQLSNVLKTENANKRELPSEVRVRGLDRFNHSGDFTAKNVVITVRRKYILVDFTRAQLIAERLRM